MVKADLIAKRWLVRAFNITTSEGSFLVVYDGQGTGYEQVLVDGEVVCKKKTIWWYAPEFEFSIGSIQAVIHIRVWAWLAVRSFQLTIDGQCV